VEYLLRGWGGGVCGVSRDASFHGGSNGNISRYVRLQPSSHGGSLIGLHLCYHMVLYTLAFTHRGREVIRSRHHLTAAALSSLSDFIRIVFFLLMSPSFVCGIGPSAVREKEAWVPQGRGL
jgi:hypothetical protein